MVLRAIGYFDAWQANLVTGQPAKTIIIKC